MNKDTLQSVLSTGFVRGRVNQAIIYFDGRDLKCDFIADNNSMTCKTVCEKFDGGNDFTGGKKIGIPDVDGLIKILQMLGKDIEVHVSTEGRSEDYLILRDGVFHTRYALITNSQMPKRLNIKTSHLSERPPKIILDKDFIGKFYKLSGSLKDCKYVYAMTQANELHMILSQSEDFNTGVRIQVKSDGDMTPMLPIKFDVKIVRSILNNMKSATSGYMEFHGEGLLSIFAEFENIKTNCYILAD